MNTRLDYLYQRYIEGNCTEEERADLLSIIAANPDDLQISALLDGTWDKIKTTELQTPENAEGILNEILTPHIQPRVKKINGYKYAAAASLFIGLCAAIFFYNSRRPSFDQNTEMASDIAPGTNRATLTLSDGKVIDLNNIQIGNIAQQAGMEITKTKDGQLVYQINEANTERNTKKQAFNTISTPRGGQYQVSLPDGTKIWLNSASSLKYPATFNGKQRRVELTGEAYFEVAKDKKHPFIVATEKQEIEVLGTHFNVNCYMDESATKTTLLEGAVQVSLLGTEKTTTLLPGQQSILDNNNLTTRIVDTEESIAWKNGYFQFNESDLSSIMKQLSRWYNVDVVFESKPSTDLFHFRVPRKLNLSEVMNLLEINGINLKKEGRTLIVK